MSQGGMVFWKFWRQSYALSLLGKKKTKKTTYQALANSTGQLVTNSTKGESPCDPTDVL